MFKFGNRLVTTMKETVLWERFDSRMTRQGRAKGKREKRGSELLYELKNHHDALILCTTDEPL